ncbi:carboxypeptidase-like regulatory domain-containing protein [Sphaerisporangium dianthi]|uniref:Carboxypeptidase-like regulatory domain-containing protein n=1 Tax=Sphaerisporangium dianthi TaxID=1436120 RepID=A0ABV9CKW9_9ACTN
MVEVLDDNGVPLAEDAVVVDGRNGAVHHLQFAAPGPRSLTIRHGEESHDVVIPVEGEPVTVRSPASAAPVPAMLRVARPSAAGYRVAFTLGDLSAPSQRSRVRAPQAGPRSSLSAPTIPGGFAKALRTLAREPVRVTDQPMIGRRGTRGPWRMEVTSGPLDPTRARQIVQTGIDRTKARYEWDFGDGTTAVTMAPFAEHDYSGSIDHRRRSTGFVIRCRSVEDEVEVSRNLTVYSAYATCRDLGTIVPPTTSELFAAKSHAGFVGQLQVRNVEEVPLILDRMAVVPLSGDLPPAFTALGTPVTIAPESVKAIAVCAPYGDSLAPDADGFTVYYAGSAGGTPVRLSATFEIPAPIRMAEAKVDTQQQQTWPWDEVVLGLDEILQDVSHDVLSPQDLVIDQVSGTVAIDVRSGPKIGAQARDAIATVLSAPAAIAGLVGVPGSAGTAALLPGSMALMALPAPGPVVEGAVCDPANLGEQERQQARDGNLACQLTTEEIEVTLPARFLNARKGDVVLSPGGPDVIGQLLRRVDPPMPYSHSGIMTRNHDEITHSTASSERLFDRIDASLGGAVNSANLIDPGALKYMWPGVVAQSVDGAVHGEEFIDPDGDSYVISAFTPYGIGSTYDDRFEVVQPLVLKPDPSQETATVRAMLHAAADSARAGAGRPGVTSKSHYRLYAYTDPRSTLTPAGPEAGWAQGTVGTVCSSFIWDVHRRLGHVLEARRAAVLPEDLEAEDVASGAEVSPNSPDGLYRYTAAERLAAATWLYDYTRRQALDQMGWLGGLADLLTDYADNIAGQLVNAFAADDDQGGNSDAWRGVTDASAISPDNLLFWDGPAQGGLYGYAEPLQFREPRTERVTISRWRRVMVSGTVSGQVRFRNAPVAGAVVQIFDGKSAITGPDGRYTLPDVPFGAYQLTAAKSIGGVLMTAARRITPDEPAETRVVDLDLEEPPERFRRVTLFFDFYGVDDEPWPFPAQISDPGPRSEILVLTPDQPVRRLAPPPVYLVADEVRIEYDITCRLLVTNAVDVEVRCLLYEGGWGQAGNTTDLDGTATTSLLVAPGASHGTSLRVHNTDEGGDWAELALTVANDRATN